MFPPTLLKILVFGVAAFVVAFAVVLGGCPFAQAAAGGADAVSSTLLGVGIGLVVLIVIDVILLLVALGVNELDRRE